MTHDSLRPSQEAVVKRAEYIIKHIGCQYPQSGKPCWQAEHDTELWCSECVISSLLAEKGRLEDALQEAQNDKAALARGVLGQSDVVVELLQRAQKAEDALQDAQKEIQTLRDGVPCDGSAAIAPASTGRE